MCGALFWPGTGLPPKDEYGNYLPGGCMPCSNNSSPGLPTCDLSGSRATALSPSIALQQIQTWCNNSNINGNKIISMYDGKNVLETFNKGFQKPFYKGSYINRDYLNGTYSTVNEFWVQNTGKPKCIPIAKDYCSKPINSLLLPERVGGARTTLTDCADMDDAFKGNCGYLYGEGVWEKGPFICKNSLGGGCGTPAGEDKVNTKTSLSVCGNLKT